MFIPEEATSDAMISSNITSMHLLNGVDAFFPF